MFDRGTKADDDPWLQHLEGCDGAPRRLDYRFDAEPDHKFAEPGALSSTLPTDLPLPRTAYRLSFGLLASRTRRKRHSVTGARATQEGPRTISHARCGLLPSRISQRSTLAIRSSSIGTHGSAANRASTSSSLPASTTCMNLEPSPSGPPSTMNPASASPSMNAA